MVRYFKLNIVKTYVFLVLANNFVNKDKGNSKLARKIILLFPNKVSEGAKVYFSSQFRLNKQIKRLSLFKQKCQTCQIFSSNAKRNSCLVTIRILSVGFNKFKEVIYFSCNAVILDSSEAYRSVGTGLDISEERCRFETETDVSELLQWPFIRTCTVTSYTNLCINMLP